MTIKSILFLLVFVLMSPSGFAKNDGFSLSNKKHKPQNLKILKKSWSKNLKSGGSKKRYYPETSNPILHQGTVYVGTHGGRFYAIDQSSGAVKWTYEGDEPISSTAAVDGGRVFFTNLGGGVIGLNTADGSLAWSQEMNQEMLGGLAVGKGKIYLLKGEHEVVALSQADGHTVWNRYIRTYVKSISMRGHAAVVLEGSSLYVGLADGHLYKLAASDGRTSWDKNLNIPLRTFKDIDAQVVIDGNSIYVGGYFGMVYRLKKSNGSITWASEVATGTPVLVTKTMVVVSDMNGALVGLDKSSGKQQWSHEFEKTVLSAPVAVDGKVFVSSFKSSAYLIDESTGRQLQKLSLGDGSISQPVVSGTQVYVLTNSAKMLSLSKI